MLRTTDLSWFRSGRLLRHLLLFSPVGLLVLVDPLLAYYPAGLGFW